MGTGIGEIALIVGALASVAGTAYGIASAPGTPAPPAPPSPPPPPPGAPAPPPPAPTAAKADAGVARRRREAQRSFGLNDTLFASGPLGGSGVADRPQRRGLLGGG